MKCINVTPQKQGNLICDAEAEYVVNGASFCQDHYIKALVKFGAEEPIDFGKPSIQVATELPT